MPTPEGKIEAYLVQRVRETGGKVRKLKWIGRSGAPDRIVWWSINGTAVIVFVEVKAPGKKMGELQKIECEKLRDDGIDAFVIDTKEEVDRMISLYKPNV